MVRKINRLSEPYRTVLVAADLTAGADIALREADRIAARNNARLVVCYAIQDPVGYVTSSLSPLMAADTLLTLKRTSTDQLEAHVTKVTGRPASGFKTSVVVGSPADVVLSEAT